MSIKKISLFLLKVFIIVIILIILIILQAYIMYLLELDNKNMSNLIISIGFTLTIINLFDKFSLTDKNKVLEENSKIIIELLKQISKTNNNNQKVTIESSPHKSYKVKIKRKHKNK